MVAECLPFTVESAWHDASGEHINVLELRGRGRIARRIARRVVQHHSRHVLLLDSRVATSASAKGRSPARKVNRELRRQLPDLLGADLEISCFWLESARNPMDNPSRRRAVWRGMPVPGEVGEWLRGERPLVDPAVLDAWRAREWTPQPPRVMRVSK